MLEAGLISFRFLHYAASMILAGALFFPLYAYRVEWPYADAFSDVRRVSLAAATFAFASGIGWLLLTVAVMSDDLAAAVDSDAIWSVLRESEFGFVWSVRLLIAVVLFGLLVPPASSMRTCGWRIALPWLAALLVASLALVGHGQMDDGTEGIIHGASDAIHLVAAASWLGGLVPLGFALSRRSQYQPRDTIEILRRFSVMGYVAVALIMASGLINSWYLVGSLGNLVGTLYGQLLLAKLILFAIMLVFAAANRFLLVPRLMAAPNSEGGESIVLRLRRHVIAEQIFGSLVLVTVSLLGTLQPGVSS